MKNKWLKYLLLVVLIIIFLGLLSSLAPNSFSREVSLLNFVQAVKKNELRRVLISDNQLVGELKTGGVIRANKEASVSFWQILKDNEALEASQNLEIKTQGFQWRDLIIGIIFNFLPFVIIAWIFWQFFAQAQKGAGQVFSFSKSGVKIYNPQKERATFADVAGLKEAKEELVEVVEFLKTPERFTRLGAQVPRGVLLIGPSGTGKTMLAKAVAGEANVSFFYISGSEFIELFVGVGASRVRDAFSAAKKNAPSILFIDELDAVGRMRGAGLGGGHDEREQTLNQILVEMDGFDKEIRCVVLAATNRPDVLDSALLRPGRFDRKVVIDLPDIREREAILQIHLKNKRVGKINVHQVAVRTPGFSGADLANLCNEAAIAAARQNRTEISQTQLLESIEKVLLGPERKSKVISKNEKEVAAYHEAGHAITAHYLPYASPVQKISIITRGRAGGYTLKLPIEEKSFHFRKEFFDELAVMLGGYAAELLHFADISTGASNDLQVATELARQIVTRYGMSETLGPITLGRARELVFLGKEIAVEKDYSEKTAQLIDEEVKKILDTALQRAQQTLGAKKDKLEIIAKQLIGKEVIEKKQFERLVGEPKGTLRI